MSFALSKLVWIFANPGNAVTLHNPVGVLQHVEAEAERHEAGQHRHNPGRDMTRQIKRQGHGPIPSQPPRRRPKTARSPNSVSIRRNTVRSGEGETTFRLPDYRNRSPMGANQTAPDGAPLTTIGGTPRALGGSRGS